MPKMSTTEHKAFKEALKDLKYGDKNLIDLVTEYYDGNDGKDKVQKANEDISSERDELKTKLKTANEEKEKAEKGLKDKVSDLEGKDAEIEKLKSNQLTPEEKQKYLDMKEKGMTPDVEANINKLKTDLEEIKKSNESEKELRISAENATKKANKEKLETDQINKIIKSLGTAKITTADNADAAIHYAQKGGLYKAEHKDDGSMSELYYTKNDKGELFTATIDEMCSYIAGKREILVDSSGNIGSGVDHGQTNNHSSSKSAESLLALREMGAAEMNANVTI